VTKASQSENSTTPKIGLTFDINDDNMVYATVAKGFRPAGAQLLAPVSQCAGDLADIGYLDANGNSTQPQIYGSDSVWSYELGTKNTVGGRVTIDASAYQIKWSNIQTSIPLPICAYGFIDNVGNATAEGVDLAIRGQVAGGLVLSGTLGYNDTTFDDDVNTPNGETLFGKGSHVPGAPSPVRYSLSGDYEFALGTLDAYAHVDYSHNNEERRAGRTSPTSASYNALYWPVEAYSTVNMRFGMRAFGGADISLFVNNLTNEHPDLGISKDQVIWSNSTLRSRTIGATVTYRY
jgi:outer membrane receptor protein involved in Fe transport